MVKLAQIIRIALIVAAFFAAAVASAQIVKVHVSSKAGDRMAAKPDLQFADAKATGGATFQINDAVKYQKMDGFGASIMEAGLITLNTLPAGQAGRSFARTL